MSKDTRVNMFWGAALILAGIFLLLSNLDILPEFSRGVWAIAFGLMAVVFLAGYLAGGVEKWWLLFPATGCGAIALTIGLDAAGAQGQYVGGLFMLIISVPFWVAHRVNRKANRWALIPAWALAAIGVVVIFSSSISGEFIGAIIMFAIATPFLGVYLANRANWWALIPAYTMGVIGLIILLSTVIGGELMGAFVMFSISFPFFVVFLANRKNSWALIPAGILAAIGLVVLFVGLLREDFIGPLILLFIAAPFLFVYLFRRDNWWALIPTGVLASVAAATFMATRGYEGDTAERAISGVLFAGLAVTFGLVWLNRRGQETNWAIYPAVGLALIALLSGLFGIEAQLVWSSGLIIFGVWLLYRASQPGDSNPEKGSEKSPGSAQKEPE